MNIATKSNTYEVHVPGNIFGTCHEHLCILLIKLEESIAVRVRARVRVRDMVRDRDRMVKRSVPLGGKYFM